MRQKDLIGQIREEVKRRNLRLFRATDFNFLMPNSMNFLWKHSDQNKKLAGNVYFKWESRGLYSLINQPITANKHKRKRP